VAATANQTPVSFQNRQTEGRALVIRKVGEKKFVLFSRDGSKRLGEFRSRKAAEDRERQILRIKGLIKKNASRN
jgi:uncharacterized protein (DUF1684 family)